MDAWTKEQSLQIHQTYVGLHKTIEHNNISTPVATSALMSLAATYAVSSDETDEYILEQFKNCLLDARTRLTTMTEN